MIHRTKEPGGHTFQLKRSSLWFENLTLSIAPAQALLHNKSHHRPILGFDVSGVLQVLAQVARHALETIDPVRSCERAAG